MVHSSGLNDDGCIDFGRRRTHSDRALNRFQPGAVPFPAKRRNSE